MRDICYEVHYRYYQYNSGMADNGEYDNIVERDTYAEAIVIKSQINYCIEINNKRKWGHPLTEAMEALEKDIVDNFISYGGYFISCKLMEVERKEIVPI